MFYTVWTSYLSFIVGFSVSVTLFAMHLPRRSMFALRAAICAAVWAGIVLGLAALYEVIPDDFGLLLGYLRFTIQYVLVLFIVYAAYDCTLIVAMFCATCGYCLQHIANRMSSILSSFLPGNQIFSVFIWFVCLAAVCVIVYFLAVHGKTRAYRDIRVVRPMQLILTTIALIAQIFVDIRIIFLVGELKGGGELMVFIFMLSALCAIIMLTLEINLLSKTRISDDFKELQRLLADERKKYEHEKANVDMINLKCHDIRHQLRAMKGKMDPEALGELSDAVDVYNAQIKTGNEAVDVVLSTQGLYCLRHDIHLTCLIDGSRLNFIPDHELYALFGNAIENAVRAVEGLDKEKRIISITENTLGKLTNICITNFFDSKLRFEDGLPVSERGEGHGFGTRSMRMIAEKYGGRLTVTVKGDLFMLNIFFPTSRRT